MTTHKRNIINVIVDIKDIIPEQYHEGLNKIATDSNYIAPEHLDRVWSKLSTYLNNIVDAPPAKLITMEGHWKFHAIALLVDETPDDFMKLLEGYTKYES